MKKVILFIPKWKFPIYILLSAFLTGLTAIALIPTIRYLDTESSRVSDFIELVGSFGSAPLVLIFSVIFTLYVLLFFRYERKRYREYLITKMVKEIKHIAEGHFDQKVTVEDEQRIGEIGNNINNIILQAEQAIADQKRSAQIKNDLVTNVAHDLRSPLTSIVGYLNLINGDQYKDEVELRHYIQIVYNKAESLHHLINDLFEYTFVQNREALMNEVPINIEEMLNQMIVQYQYQVQNAGMEMRLFQSSPIDPVVMGDGNKLARVFENLIQNAIRYGKDGKYIDIKLTETEEMAEIEIANYGQVIPSADIPHIFERFYRVEKSRSEYTGGSGLGLAIVKSIVELHNGQIEVKSSSGKTAFIVKLWKNDTNEI
ncbi:sensor histidine kinase [Cytobacillus praedii]|uniref:sensor histidine kinase n=1 Tax=Cytobacillus praedii TaxID=1742358 RepID=UPI002E1C3B43|nr:ATP-binding protein [Cytobacillus praedii]